MTSVYVVGEVLILAGGLISFPIFTRILDQAEYGLMSLVTVTLVFAEVIATLGLRHAAQRYYYAYEKRGDGRDFYGTMLCSAVLFGGLGTVATAAGAWALARAGLLSPQAAHLVVIASGLVVVRVATKMLGCFYRVKERVKILTVFSVGTKYAGMLLAIALVAVFGQGVAGFLWGLLAGESVIFVLMFLCGGALFGFPRLALRRTILAEAVRYGLPMVAASFGVYVLSMGDRYIVAHFMRPEDVAIYSVPYNLCSYLSALMLASYELAFVPLIMERWEAGSLDEVRHLTENVSKLYGVVAFPVIFGLSAVGDLVLGAVASERYVVASGILPFVIAGEMLKGLFTPLTIGLQFKNRTDVIAKLTWGVAALNILLNLLLVPRYGLHGAAISTVVSYLALLAFGALFAFKCFPIAVPWGAFGRYFLCSALMFAAVRAAALTGERRLPVLVALGLTVFGSGLLTVSGEARRVAATLFKRDPG